MATVWKIAPGERACFWDVCRRFNCIVIGWTEIGDYQKYKSQDAIVKALEKKWRPDSEQKPTGSARSIWRFVNVIKPSDVVVANDGDSVVVGIGRVKSRYFHEDHRDNPVPLPGEGEYWWRNVRLVNWLITKPIDLRKEHYFVASTVTHLNAEKCGEIRRIYLKEYPGLEKTLDDLFAHVSDTDDPDNGTEAGDLREIEKQKIKETKKKQLVEARIGQGTFRKEVLQLWGNQCAVTGSRIFDAIRASHIRPWCDSSDKARLDPSNGLPLIATLDALFDAGLISFESSGEMLISPKLTDADRSILGISDARLATKPSGKTAKYLAYHRENRFDK